MTVKLFQLGVKVSGEYMRRYRLFVAVRLGDTVAIGHYFTTLVSNDWIKGLFESDAMEKVDSIGFHLVRVCV